MTPPEDLPNGAPPCILLRGLSRSARHWGDVPERLAQALPGRRVLAIDLPGNGALCTQRSATRVATMATQAREQVLAAGLTPPYLVIALSLGGMVACEWAATRPEELAGLVLVNSSLRGLSPVWQRLRPSAWPALLRLAVLPVGDVGWEATLFALTSCRPALRPATLAHWLALRRAEPVSRWNVLRQLLAAARYRAPSPPRGLPTLVLASRTDQLVDPRCSRAIARHRTATLLEHPSAGHDLPLDDPDWLVVAVAGWQAQALTRRGSAAPSDAGC